MKIRLTAILVLLLGGSSTLSLMAQDYEDDIYYTPSKVNTQKKSTSIETNSYPAADTYTPAPGNGSNFDVDTYNRRGIFAKDSVSTPKDRTENFEYTRQIERFYNPQIITESNDENLASYYYSEPANVNITINTPGYWGYTPYYYYSPRYWGTPTSWWYYNSWSYNPWCYDPWHWDWGPSWGWGYPYYWGHYHHYYPTWSHNRPSSWGNSRPGYRPSYTNGHGNTRPGYRTSTTGNYRPGNSTGTYKPSSSSSGYRQGRGNNRSNSNSYSRPINNQNSNYYSRPGNNYNRSESSSFRSGSSRSSGSSGYRSGSGRGRH